MAAPRSVNIKAFLLLVAVVMVVGTLIYTQYIVQELLVKEREGASLYAKSLQFIANRAAAPGVDQTDYSFIFDEVIRSIDFPMVLSDPQGQPITPYRTSARNIEIDTTLSEQEQEIFFRETIADLDRQNPPIKITLQDSIVLSYVHYGESHLVSRLRWLPYIEFALAGMFILLGYVGFSTIKRNEQSSIWVGMSKETAHQLGTPLSSLMGWIEIMKGHAEEDPRQMVTIAEMENDIKRLQIVTERFSKIGSKPSLKSENLYDVIDAVIVYFQRRLPTRTGDRKNIAIRIDSELRPAAMINRDLFTWVIENLIKNAVDAMEDGTGTITFTFEESSGAVYIDVKDSGKGIDAKSKKEVFRPGYSTKQRGWGLGLSLSRRIIETYHKGKIFVKESRLGKGTTFRIKLLK
jgi:signal transduction histidine kinase